MPNLLPTDPDNPAFIKLVKNLNQGDTVDVIDGTLIVEEKFIQPTHFLWHQRVFPAGIILNKLDENEHITKLRIYISAEQLGWDIADSEEIDDRQITEEGEVLQPER